MISWIELQRSWFSGNLEKRISTSFAISPAMSASSDVPRRLRAQKRPRRLCTRRVPSYDSNPGAEPGCGQSERTFGANPSFIAPAGDSSFSLLIPYEVTYRVKRYKNFYGFTRKRLRWRDRR
jgi:hypothetical protein